MSHCPPDCKAHVRNSWGVAICQSRVESFVRRLKRPRKRLEPLEGLEQPRASKAEIRAGLKKHMEEKVAARLEKHAARLELEAVSS